MSDRETTEIVLHGKWSAFEDRGEWRQFEIVVEGKQYPYKLSTKKPEVIEAMMAVRDEEATFYGAEQESDKINERSGKPYMNRYLNDVKAGTVGQEALPGTSSGGGGGGKSPAGGSRSGGEDTMTSEDWDAKERRRTMSLAWAHTLTANAHTFFSDESPDAQFKRLQSYQRKIYVDICGEFAYPKNGSDLPTALRPDPDSDRAPLSPADEDIPF